MTADLSDGESTAMSNAALVLRLVSSTFFIAKGDRCTQTVRCQRSFLCHSAYCFCRVQYARSKRAALIGATTLNFLPPAIICVQVSFTSQLSHVEMTSLPLPSFISADSSQLCRLALLQP